MQGLNVIAVFSTDKSKWLMCRRRKNPYKGLSNLVGGKIEPGESGIDAAYRELYEETAITREDITLTHLMDFTYHLDQCRVEVYAGRLHQNVDVHGEENELYWSDLEHDFFDQKLYAGEGNLGHMLEHIKMSSHKLL